MHSFDLPKKRMPKTVSTSTKFTPRRRKDPLDDAILLRVEVSQQVIIDKLSQDERKVKGN